MAFFNMNTFSSTPDKVGESGEYPIGIVCDELYKREGLSMGIGFTPVGGKRRGL
jgi:hypothetical protein